MESSLRTFRTIYQVFFSFLVVIALTAQFIYGGLAGGFTTSYIALFFSYFTILSNVLVAIMFYKEAHASLNKKGLSARFEWIRGFAVFCIITTGIIYTFFLRGPGVLDQLANALPWANTLFHQVMPIAVVLDWILFPPKRTLKWISVLYWIALTAIYAIYVEVLGLFAHTYPYFFLNPTRLGGYDHLLRACAAFIPFFLVFGFVIVLVNKIRTRFKGNRITKR